MKDDTKFVVVMTGVVSLLIAFIVWALIYYPEAAVTSILVTTAICLAGAPK